MINKDVQKKRGPSQRRVIVSRIVAGPCRVGRSLTGERK